MNESQTMAETEAFVLIGLPSPLLNHLAGECGLMELNDAGILHACTHPLEMGVFRLNRIRENLEASCRSRQSARLLMVYTAPGDFLERQFGHVAETLRLQRVDIATFAGDVLAFWHAYHLVFLEQYESRGGQDFLVNGDRGINVATLQSRLAGWAEGAAPDLSGLAPSLDRWEDFNPLGTCFDRIVAELAPDSLRLYEQLERLQSGVDGDPGTDPGSAVAGVEKLAPALLHLLSEHTLVRRELGTEDPEDLVEQLKAIREEREVLRSALSGSDLEKKDLLLENGLLLRQVREVQSELARVYRSDDWRPKPGQTGANEGLDRYWTPHGSRSRLRRFGHSLLFAFEYPLQVMDALVPLPGNERRQLKRKMKILARSGFFDKGWYLARYPDVAASGRKPVEHYFNDGAMEGRNPGPYFDTNWYLRMYPDVTEAGINPLLHYIQNGRKEGRLPRPI